MFTHPKRTHILRLIALTTLLIVLLAPANISARSKPARRLSLASGQLSAISHWPSAISHPLSAAPGSAITYTYDAAGRLVRADYAGGKSIIYTYDSAGNLLRREVVRGAKVYLPVIMRHDK